MLIPVPLRPTFRRQYLGQYIVGFCSCLQSMICCSCYVTYVLLLQNDCALFMNQIRKKNWKSNFVLRILKYTISVRRRHENEFYGYRNINGDYLTQLKVILVMFVRPQANIQITVTAWQRNYDSFDFFWVLTMWYTKNACNCIQNKIMCNRCETDYQAKPHWNFTRDFAILYTQVRFVVKWTWNFTFYTILHYSRHSGDPAPQSSPRSCTQHGYDIWQNACCFSDTLAEVWWNVSWGKVCWYTTCAF